MMLLSTLSWALLFLAAVLLLRGLFWDRPGFRGRPQRRCRRCWYDLTGAGASGTAVGEDPDGRGEPRGVVCPECGKKHGSVRAMRKTRRGKRWVAAALACFLCGYTAGVWPRVSAQYRSLGWVVLVPTPVLILMIPVLPDEPGSLPERGTPATSIPYPQRAIAERVAHQIKTRLYDPAETSGLDRRLFEFVARRHSWRSLTDHTAIRGGVFTYVYNGLARQSRLRGEEERWARSVHWMDVDAPEALPQMSPVYIRINEFRRLISVGVWRVQIEDTLFERRGSGLGHVSGENAYRDGHVRIADYVRWANAFSDIPYEDLAIRGRIYEGEPAVDLWWPVGVIEDSVRVAILPSERSADRDSMRRVGGVDYVEDDATIDWLDNAIEMRLVWDRSGPSGDPIPTGVRIELRDGMRRTDVPGFTFGGSVSIEIDYDHGGPFAQGSRGPETAAFLTRGAWWALRDERDESGDRVFDGERMVVDLNPDWRDTFRYLGCCDEHSEITAGWFLIRVADHLVGGGDYAALWDLDAERVYPSPIRLPMTDADIRLLERALRAMMSGQPHASP